MVIVNINSEVIDSFYRYKMFRFIVKVVFCCWLVYEFFIFKK